MSNLVVFLIKDKITYEQTVAVSNNIVRYCLENNKGALFNFLGYGEDLINQLAPSFYFSISDDFLQLNSNYLSSINNHFVKKTDNEKDFFSKFKFLDDIYALLQSAKIRKIQLLISSDGSSERIEDFLQIAKGAYSFEEILYDIFLKEQVGITQDFPELIINSPGFRK